MIDKEKNLILKQIKSISVDENLTNLFSLNEIKSLQPFLKRHNFEHLLFDIMQKNGVEDIESLSFAKQIKNKAVFKSLLQEDAIQKTKSAFENAKIGYILLKGARIKKLYAQEWMRVSDDVDILVKPEDLKKAEDAIEKAGFMFNARSTHDVSFVDENKIKIELHYDLIEDSCAKNANAVLKNVWDSAVKKDGYEYFLTDDMMYFYHIAHIAKHFELGGCGVKAILDTFLLNQIDFDAKKRNELLIKGELNVFAQKIEKLAENWFVDEEVDSELVSLTEYIIRGGNFGSYSNYALTKKATKKGALKELLFPKKSDMEKLFPAVKKSVLLLPMFWVVRIVKKIFKGNSKRYIKKIRSINGYNQANEFFDEIGL